MGGKPGFGGGAAIGTLTGYSVVELAGVGPAPFAAMLLADMGASVLRIERRGAIPAIELPAGCDIPARGRNVIELDLGRREEVEVLLGILDGADVLIEGFRPGVAERLGIGPDVCRGRNPALVYARMTGFGQTGPLAGAAGHDIHYLALTGVLHAIGRAGERPVPPLNLVADYGGGGTFLAMGVLAALLERARSGLGQVVDAAMIDGAALLMAATFGYFQGGAWTDERGVNGLDGGCPYYDTYRTRDGKFMAVGALEPKFFAQFAQAIGLDETWLVRRTDQRNWPALRDELTHIFAGRTRAEWTHLLEGTDACVVPVLSMAEAPTHPHNLARQTFVERGGVVQPAPAPRFSRTASQPPQPASSISRNSEAALAEFGVSAGVLDAWRSLGSPA